MQAETILQLSVSTILIVLFYIYLLNIIFPTGVCCDRLILHIFIYLSPSS